MSSIPPLKKRRTEKEEEEEMSILTGRPLHYVIKIGDRKKAYDFYTGVLGMKVLRHEEFEEGCKAECNGPYNGKWSKTMIGYGDESDHFVIEMTYNYEIGGYTKGNELHGIYIDNVEVFNKLTADGSSTLDQDGRLHLRDPDGNSVYLGGEEARPDHPRISRLTLNVVDLEKSIAFWSTLLHMEVVMKYDDSVTLSYSTKSSRDKPSFILQLRQSGKPIDRGTAYGRTAFACPSDQLAPLEGAIKEAGKGKVLKPLVSLDTPGKATVHVVILADPDGHEICFVGDEAFRELSQIDHQGNEKIEKAMKEDWSLEWFKDGKKTI